MTIRHLALLSESTSVKQSDIQNVAAALQKQIVRDLAPIWGIQATISAFSDLESVPVGYWPIIIKDDIGQPGAGGFHSSKNNQPFALILAGDDWMIATSHETIEMLIDPSGNNLVAGDSLKKGQGRVQYLLEACDPCEGGQYAYSINGVTVSDFITPHYHDPVAGAGVRYSYTGAITAPREVLPEGYISWFLPGTQTVWQAFNVNNKLQIKELGNATDGMSLREFVDMHSSVVVPPYTKSLKKNTKIGATDIEAFMKPSNDAAKMWREAMAKLGFKK